MSDSSSTTHSDGRQSTHQDTETMTSASSISTQESEAETESTVSRYDFWRLEVVD